MESDVGHPMKELRVDGGATANPYLMQFQADVLGKTVRRPKILETTAMGAAMLAGLAGGLWKTPAQLDGIIKGADIFKPKMKSEERNRLVAGWRAAVARVLTTRQAPPQS